MKNNVGYKNGMICKNIKHDSITNGCSNTYCRVPKTSFPGFINPFKIHKFTTNAHRFFMDDDCVTIDGVSTDAGSGSSQLIYRLVATSLVFYVLYMV